MRLGSRVLLVAFLVGLALLGSWSILGCSPPEPEAPAGDEGSGSGSGSGGGTPAEPPSSFATAQEATQVILEYMQAEWAADAVLLALSASAYRPIDDPVFQEGACEYWTGSCYSPSKKESIIVHYQKGAASKAGSPWRTDLTLNVADWSKWAVDSAEALAIAAENGFTSIDITVRAIETHDPASIPGAVEELGHIFWELEAADESLFYISAETGEVIPID